MALGDAEAVTNLLQADGCGGFQLLRGQAGAAKLRGKRHRETPGVCRGQQLLRISTHAVLKARAKGILRLLEDAAVSGNRAFAGLQVTLPDGTCFALHAVSPCFYLKLWNDLQSRGFDSLTLPKGILNGRSCRESSVHIRCL